MALIATIVFWDRWIDPLAPQLQAHLREHEGKRAHALRLLEGDGRICVLKKAP